MVRSEQCCAAELIAEIQKGTYYFSQAPVIEDWGFDEKNIYFQCSPCREIHVTTYPPRGRSFYAKDGEKLTEIVYPLKGGETYIRIECIDENGCTAWTNPHFF